MTLETPSILKIAQNRGLESSSAHSFSGLAENITRDTAYPHTALVRAPNEGRNSTDLAVLREWLLGSVNGERLSMERDQG